MRKICRAVEVTDDVGALDTSRAGDKLPDSPLAGLARRRV